MAEYGSYRLYGGGITQAASVEAVLRELDLDFTLVPVDIMRREHRSEAFRELNPAGYLPALVTPEGEVLHENVAIMLYLADLHPDAGLSPALTDPRRGRFLSRLMFLNNDIQTRTKCFFYPHRWSTEKEDAPRIRRRAFDAVMEAWALYDRWLAADGPFALGQTASIAEIYMAVWVTYGLEEASDITDRNPAIAECYRRILQRPATGKAITGLKQAL